MIEGQKHSVETKEKMKLLKLGKKRKEFTTEWKEKMSLAKKGKKPNNFGKKVSIEKRKQWSNARRGNKTNLWKHGKSLLKKTKRNQIMLTFDYKEWRRCVFERDNWTCQKCGDINKRLEAHHIKTWNGFPKLRFDVNNGKTLCKRCHILEHKKESEIR